LKPVISVIAPIYNESKTLETMISKIQKELSATPFEIIIVDDNSPDGSGEIADQLAERHQNIKVLHRDSKKGLGTAYKEGFKYTLGDYIVSIDSDLSHDPAYIPAMVELASKYDVVIGSRLCRGGQIVGRGLTRNILTVLTNLVLRLLLSWDIHDWTSGYRVYRRQVWSKVMPNVHCDKWDFQFESLFKSLKQGFSVVETPITFYERADGDSKFTVKEALVFLGSFVKVTLGLK